MYPHPQLNTYLQGFNPHMPKQIFNQLVDKVLQSKSICGDFKSELQRVTSNQPQCYAPHVDVTRAQCAFKQFALPKLKEDLGSGDPLTLRQAVTTLGDCMYYPEKLVKAIELKIPDSLAPFLTSNDPYLRERTAMAYATIANQNAGRKAIMENLTTIAYLSKSLDDRLAAVRLQVARVLEALVFNNCVVDQLRKCGFIEAITSKLCNERKDILVIYLDSLSLLLRGHNNATAIKNGTFDKLMELLKRKDEKVLCKSLICLRVLCEDCCGKQKALEVDLLCILKKFLTDDRESVNVEAARVASFITITTRGKLRVLELKMTTSLLCTATEKCCISPELLLAIIKILTNVAEAPEGRKMLLEYDTLIEGIGVGDCEVLRRHRQTLLDVVRWRP